jgi:hypothetical protein
LTSNTSALGTKLAAPQFGVSRKAVDVIKFNRPAGAEAVELGHQQRTAARQQIDRIEKQLQRIDEKLLPEQAPHVEPSATHYDSGAAHAGVAKREIARAKTIPQPKPECVRGTLGSLGQTGVPLQDPSVGESSRSRVLAEYGRHYHSERNHQGKGNRLLFPNREQPNSHGVRSSVVAHWAVCSNTIGGPHEYFYRTGTAGEIS